VAVLFNPARDAEAVARRGLRFSPAEFFRRGLEDRAQSFVLQILQTKLQGVHPAMREGVRELVHGRLAREMVSRRGQRAIRTLAKRRAGGMKLGALVRD